MPTGLLSFAPSLAIKRFFPSSSKVGRTTRKGRQRNYPLCVAKSLEEAVDKGFVQDFGRIVKLDPGGYFPVTNDLRISETLRESLDAVVSSVCRVLGYEDVRAIFVRGSVATGNFLSNGRSDLDLIVVARKLISSHEKLEVYAAVSSVIKRTLALSGADIQYIQLTSSWFGTNQNNIPANLRILLRNYAVPLYSVGTGIVVQDTRDKPTGDGALNIRKYERSFLRLFEKGANAHDFQIQRDSMKWICKNALRAIAELSSLRTNQHSRDLIPCYRLATVVFPDHADTLLLGLQLACASSDNRYLGLSKSSFLTSGYNVARDMVEIAEALSLSQNFAVSNQIQSELGSTTASELFPTPSWADHVNEVTVESFARLRWALKPKKLDLENCSFLRNRLPTIPLQYSSVADSTVEVREESKVTTRPYKLSQNLLKASAPHIVRKALSTSNSSSADTRSILEELLRTTRMVQCRVSPGSEFTFCRATHRWIDANKFSPPSILISMTVESALLRMIEGYQCHLPPLLYAESDQERIYIQTRVMRSKRMFTELQTSNLRIAQEERMWISTHGSVSGLHFDSSHSALLQRTGSKRMIFFPPECLEYMGIYPLGHPLHRRSRVNLTRPESILFKDFWKVCSSKAIEAVLEEGDLIVFPPFWSHYTESITSKPNELSISHTIRFI